MTFDEYIPEAIKTAVFIDKSYPYVSLLVESAELLDVFVKPLLRGDNDGQVDRDKVIKEVGDCYWNLAAICDDVGAVLHEPRGAAENNNVIDMCLYMNATAGNIARWREDVNPVIIDVYRDRMAALLQSQGITESEVLEANLKKLADRAARGVIKGSGGER